MVYTRFQYLVGNTDPVPQDILDDVLSDPDVLAYFELLDQQALMDAICPIR
jgi:hypothetical protein